MAFPADDAGQAEGIHPYPFGAGLKLGEQAYCWEKDGIKLASAYSSVFGLLATTRWAGRRLIVVGDYAEPTDVNGFTFGGVSIDQFYGTVGAYRSTYQAEAEDTTPFDLTVDISEDAAKLLAEAAGYTAAGDGWKDLVLPDDLMDRAKRWLEMDDGMGNYVIVSSCGEYIRPLTFATPPRSKLAMPFLGAAWAAVLAMCACADGRGGGDLDLDPAGRWAGTIVGVIPEANMVDGLVDVTDWVASHRKFSWLMGVD